MIIAESVCKKEDWGEHWQISLDSRAPQATNNFQPPSFPKKQVKKLKIDKPMIVKHIIEFIRPNSRSKKHNFIIKANIRSLLIFFWWIKSNQYGKSKGIKTNHCDSFASKVNQNESESKIKWFAKMNQKSKKDFDSPRESKSFYDFWFT